MLKHSEHNLDLMKPKHDLSPVNCDFAASGEEEPFKQQYNKPYT